MSTCSKFRADLVSRITGIPKKLILNTYYEKNTEYKVDNENDKKKTSDFIFGIEGYVINIEFNNSNRVGIIERNDAYLGRYNKQL